MVSGADALRRAGIAPLELGGKDGLALISANGVSIGQAALVVARAAAVAEAADVAAALSMEAIEANTSILQPAVGRAKPIPGQIAAADHLRALARREPAAGPGRRAVGPGPAVVPGRSAGPRGAARVRHARPGPR